jgi:hypothetical protein
MQSFVDLRLAGPYSPYSLPKALTAFGMISEVAWYGCCIVKGVGEGEGLVSFLNVVSVTQVFALSAWKTFVAYCFG